MAVAIITKWSLDLPVCVVALPPVRTALSLLEIIFYALAAGLFLTLLGAFLQAALCLILARTLARCLLALMLMVLHLLLLPAILSSYLPRLITLMAATFGLMMLELTWLQMGALASRRDHGQVLASLDRRREKQQRDVLPAVMVRALEELVCSSA